MLYLDTIKLFIYNIVKKYPKEFTVLILLMVADAFIIALSVLSLIPFADYLLDPNLSNPNKFTNILLNLFTKINISPSYFSFAFIIQYIGSQHKHFTFIGSSTLEFKLALVSLSWVEFPVFARFVSSCEKCC